MEHQFWHEKWQQNHIGFNEALPHRLLTQNLTHFASPTKTSIFVPLCGKSVDMLWLTQQGFNVIGIELSELAISDFFKESNLKPRVFEQGDFTVWQTENIKLFNGDFFALTSTEVSDCACLYDRAALIALPEDMRKDYAAHLNNILPAEYKALIISLNYPPHQKAGPPFSVSTTEIERLFKDKEVETIISEEVLDTHPHFAKNGMTTLIETAYRF